MKEYDLVVIGGGTAGLVPAAGGASLGAKVALVERDKLGGECLNYGCVPTKSLIKSAKVASLMRRAPEFGMAPVQVEVDFPAVMDRMRSIIEKAGEPDDPQRFRDLGVDVYLGKEARFEAPLEVSVGGERLRGASVILATGSHAKKLPVEGLEEAGYVDNVSVLEMERLPRSMVIVGGGPIGCEFAQMFARLGSRVGMVSMDRLPLPVEDPEISRALEGYLQSDGVKFHGGCTVESVRLEDGEKVVTARDESRESIEMWGEEILVAAGRSPSVDGLGLENAGIEVGKGGVKVDEHLMTTAENVYAAGDVTGDLLFTHAAEYQGRIALQNALFPVRTQIDYSAIPWTTFTDPEVARVGLTERQAMEQHGEGVRGYTFSFEDLDRALCDGEPHGFAKIVTDKSGRVLGGHIIGPDAGNYISELTLAVKKGMKVGELSTTVHVYPTLAESIKKAADNYNRERLFSGPLPKLLKGYFAVRRRLS